MPGLALSGQLDADHLKYTFLSGVAGGLDIPAGARVSYLPRFDAAGELTTGPSPVFAPSPNSGPTPSPATGLTSGHSSGNSASSGGGTHQPAATHGGAGSATGVRDGGTSLAGYTPADGGGAHEKRAAADFRPQSPLRCQRARA